MRFNNFKISSDNVGIETEAEGYLDLHNNFELESIQYEFSLRRLKINWRRSSGDWVPDYSFNKFRLEFSDVTVFRVKELDKETLSDFPEDDGIVDQIGLTSRDDADFLGVFPYVEIKEESDALCLYTANGQALIIYAGEVYFIKE